VAIGDSENAQRAALTSDWRSTLKQAERRKTELAEGSGEDLYRSFRELYAEMRARKGFPAFVDADEFGRIQERLAEELKMHVIVCRLAGRPVSALVISRMGDTAVAILAAASPEGRRLEASYLMWWRAINWLRQRGCRRLDLGGYDPQRAPGPALFKKGLAGKSAQPLCHVGSFHAPGSVLGRLLLGSAQLLKGAAFRVKHFTSPASASLMAGRTG